MSRNLKNHVNENVATQTSSSQLSAEFVSSVAHADSDNRPQRHSHSDESHRQRKTKKVESKRQQQSFAWAPQMAIDNVDTNDNDSSSSIYCDRYINVSAFESIDSLHCDQCAFVHQTNSTRSNCVYHLCRCHFDNCIDYNRFNYQQSARCDTKFGAISVRTVHPNRNEVNLVNSSSQQCHRIIYENLCQFCGSAIGSAASHLNCNRKWPSEQLKNWRDNNFNAIKSNNVDANDGDCNDNDDNIYENICARCHSICSSETCSKCLREGNKVNEQKQQHKVNVENVGATTKVSHANGKTFGKQFSNLFDSLKRKLKDRTQLSSSTFATEPKEPTKSKIEIIHNFDKVFKTNQTFDLDEIVQLKLQNTSAHDIYGKLDESVCSLVTNRAEEFLSSRQHFLSTSESNFFADRQQLQLQQHQNQQQQRQQQLPRQFNSGVAFDLPFDLETFASDSALYLVPPSYEDAIQNSLYKSVSSVTQSTPASSFYSHVSSSSSLSSSTTFAASVWSLSFDNFLNNNESLHQWMTSLRTQTEDYFDTDFPLFECSIIKCIPAKTIFTEKSQESKSKTKTKSTLSLDSLELHDRVAKFKENFNAQMLSKLNAFDANNLMVTSATATSSICFIESDSLQPVVIRSTNEIDSIRKYFENVKNFYVVQIALATGLNRTILICGDTRLHFLCKFLSSDRHTFDKRQINWIFSTDRVQQFFEKMSIEKTFGDTKKLPAIGNADKTMAKEFQAFSNVKHDHSNSMQSNESTNENTDCSSNSELMRDDSSQNALNNEEWTTADESADHERSIYQTIWTFETLGAASTNDSDEMCESELSEAIVDDCSEWEEVTNAEFVFSSSRFSSHANTPITHRRRDEMVNTQPQMNCKISNVSFTAYDDDNDERNCKSSSSPLPIYRRVCILYNGENTKFNKIIHDHNRNVDNELNPFGNEYANIVQNVMRPTETATNTEKTETKNSGSSSRTSDSNNRKFGRNSVSEESENANKTDVNDRATNVQSLVSIDSVIAWQNMLRSVNYIEDEEDLILSETFLMNKSPSNLPAKNDEIKLSNSSNSTAKSIEKVPSLNSSNRNESDDLPKIQKGQIITETPFIQTVQSEVKTKREIGFLNKLQYKRFDISRNNATNVKKDDIVQGICYKNLNGKDFIETSPPMEIKRATQIANIVFGASLDEVEKDENFPEVPKFVIECIKVIELKENIETNGIYRASGKKESIDKLKKKMNESKLRKGTKYACLKDEDVHTVTGALKQFFRELKTDLIPIEVVKNLPNISLDSKETICRIRYEMDKIDYLPRETLRYLLRHLIRVDQNSQQNLMNTSNLSIVWGACIFTSSVATSDVFDPSDVVKKNTLFRILLEHYDDIFIDVDRLI